MVVVSRFALGAVVEGNIVGVGDLSEAYTLAWEVRVAPPLQDSLVAQ